MEIKCTALVEIPDYIGIGQEEILTVEEGKMYEPYKWGLYVGRIYSDSQVKSAFKKDIQNGNCEMFESLKNDVCLIKKHVTVRNETNELVAAHDYYIPYAVQGHGSMLPTVTDRHVDHCNNVHYSVQYEVLFVAEDGYKRYLLLEYETEGSFATTFFDQVENLRDEIEEMFDDGLNGFIKGEDGEFSAAFYDETGDRIFIDLSSISELMSMIASIRVVKLDYKIMR